MRKKNLPLLGREEVVARSDPPPKKPSIDAARARLGGKDDVDPAARRYIPGQVVSFPMRGERAVGVVLHAGPKEIHVLLDGVRLKRLAPDEVSIHFDAVDEELTKIASDARVFGSLLEGQGVRYTGDGGLRDGRLVEKCRWGALVLRDDGAVVAVGFRKLWPAMTAGAA